MDDSGLYGDVGYGDECVCDVGCVGIFGCFYLCDFGYFDGLGL